MTRLLHYLTIRLNLIVFCIVIGCFSCYGDTADDNIQYNSTTATTLYLNQQYYDCIIYTLDAAKQRPLPEDLDRIYLCGLTASYDLVKNTIYQFTNARQSHDDAKAKTYLEDLDLNYELQGRLIKLYDYIQYYYDIITQNKESAEDIRKYVSWKTCQIGILQAFMTILEENDKDAQKEYKKCAKEYIKKVQPYINDRNIFSKQEFYGSFFATLFTCQFCKDNSSTSKALDYMLTEILPDIKEIVENESFTNEELYLTINQFTACCDVINSFIRIDELNDKLKPADIDKACNLSIISKTLKQYITGTKRYKPILFTTWQDIQKVIDHKTQVVELFETPGGKDVFLYAYKFDKYSSVPEIEYNGHPYMATHDHSFRIFNSWERKNGYNDIYFSCSPTLSFYAPELGCKDAHRMRTVAEICLPKAERNKTGTICSIADINYTLGNNSIAQSSASKGVATSNISGAREEQKHIKEIFGTTVVDVSGDNATKLFIRMLNGAPMDVLHISTHGYYDSNANAKLNQSNPEGVFFGDNTYNSCGLKLSGYNNDPQNGSISGYEISKLDLSKIGLVFLDACQTGDGKVVFGKAFSLAEAFHAAGVRYIIATTDEIADAHATQFCKDFFANLAKGLSYHDAFYATPQDWKTGLNYSNAPLTDDARKSITKGHFVLWE